VPSRRAASGDELPQLMQRQLTELQQLQAQNNSLTVRLAVVSLSLSPSRHGGLAQLVATLVGSTRLLYAGPG